VVVVTTTPEVQRDGFCPRQQTNEKTPSCAAVPDAEKRSARGFRGGYLAWSRARARGNRDILAQIVRCAAADLIADLRP